MCSRSPRNLKFAHFTLFSVLPHSLLFAVDGKEMDQILKRTCRVIFFHINLLFCGVEVAIAVVVT